MILKYTAELKLITGIYIWSSVALLTTNLYVFQLFVTKQFFKRKFIVAFNYGYIFNLHSLR